MAKDNPSIPPATRRLVRCLFVTAAAACAFQYFIADRVGEPYPALFLPSFSGTGGCSEGQVHVRRVEVVLVCSDGEEIAMHLREFLSEYDDSLHDAIANHCFSPRKGTAAPTVSQGRLRAALYALFPGLKHDNHTDAAQSLSCWIKNRVRVLAPDRRICSVEFRWHDDILALDARHRSTTWDGANVYVVSVDS